MFKRYFHNTLVDFRQALQVVWKTIPQSAISRIINVNETLGRTLSLSIEIKKNDNCDSTMTRVHVNTDRNYTSNRFELLLGA